METALAGWLCVEWRGDGVNGATAYLKPNKRAYRKDQEGDEETQEIGVYRENRCSEKTGKSQHGKKKRIAIRAGAIKTNDRNKNQEMHSGENYGVESRIGDAGGKMR